VIILLHSEGLPGLIQRQAGLTIQNGGNRQISRLVDPTHTDKDLSGLM
jgi:hypothetical protein